MREKLSGLVVEKRDAHNLAYILQTPDLFFLTGYKVLLTQAESGFVPCARVTHNGKDKLVYDIAGLQTLAALLPRLDSPQFLAILTNIFEVIDEVKGNGFMQCENIVTDFNKIFIDSNNLQVRLVYLPVNVEVSPEDSLRFESTLKDRIKEAIKEHSHLESPDLRTLCKQLEEPTFSVAEISEFLRTTGFSLPRQQPEPKQPQAELKPEGPTEQKDTDLTKKKTGLSGLFARSKDSQPVESFTLESQGGATEILDDIFTPEIIIVGVRTPEAVELPVTKPEFVIGKNAASVDGHIGFNNAISRKHCKIICDNGRYFIVDLGSTNGTYVNEKKLIGEQKIPLKVGDKVRLANSNFIIKSC